MARKSAAVQPVKRVQDMTDEELEASMTPEEQAYLDALHADLEQGRIVPNRSEEEHARVRANAQYTLELLAQERQAPRERASKRITVRVTPSDLATLHAKAEALGLPYQTLLKSIVHQYLTGQLVPARGQDEGKTLRNHMSNTKRLQTPRLNTQEVARSIRQRDKALRRSLRKGMRPTTEPTS
jgi:predicted DNA binding CopG/RHH family protein